MQFVGKRSCKIAHFTRKGPVFLHGGLVLDAKCLLSFLLHVCIDLKKCWMDRGTPNPGGLAQNARVGWMRGSEMGPLWATFPSDA